MNRQEECDRIYMIYKIGDERTLCREARLFESDLDRSGPLIGLANPRF